MIYWLQWSVSIKDNNYLHNALVVESPLNDINGQCILCIKKWVAIKEVQHKYFHTLALMFSKLAGLINEKHIRKTSWNRNRETTFIFTLQHTLTFISHNKFASFCHGLIFAIMDVKYMNTRTSYSFVLSWSLYIHVKLVSTLTHDILLKENHFTVHF